METRLGRIVPSETAQLFMLVRVLFLAMWCCAGPPEEQCGIMHWLLLLSAALPQPSAVWFSWTPPAQRVNCSYRVSQLGNVALILGLGRP